MFFLLLLPALIVPSAPVDDTKADELPSPFVASKTRAEVRAELERAYRAGERTARGEIDTTPR